MNDATHLFHTADLHFAAKGRIDAINASPNLHWLIAVPDGDRVVTLAFDHAPTLVQIALRMRDKGLAGPIEVRSITVGRKRKRPLILMPWMRAKLT